MTDAMVVSSLPIATTLKSALSFVRAAFFILSVLSELLFLAAVDHFVDGPLPLRDEIEQRQQKLPVLGQQFCQLAARKLGRRIHNLILSLQDGGFVNVEKSCPILTKTRQRSRHLFDQTFPWDRDIIRAAMDEQGVTTAMIERCEPTSAKEVLALAAQAWPEAERAAYWKIVRDLVRSGQPERVVLVAARQDDRLLAAQIGQSLPGRVAIVWPPQFAPNQAGATAIGSRLFERLLCELAASGAELAQALLPCDDTAVTAAFREASFLHAADLLYMTVEKQQFPTEPLDLPFELEPFSPAHSPRLAQLIERTYIGTLDCPKMDGLRNTEDVIAGYQAVGEFKPELWHIVRQEGTDVGCLLVNVHRDVLHAEIVYMALAPEVRGRGWGVLLARHAQRLAQQAGCERVVLAVDAANAPAICPYGRAGFSTFDHRAVWIRELP